VTCFDACHEPGVGYHILLQDLSEEYHDRKEATPTLAHGLALAEALARMHRHHWGKGTPPTEEDWQPSLAHIRPGVSGLEATTGRILAERFEAHANLLIERWSQPVGLSLLHGDVNPTNILTPKEAESPVLILDRQPFEWGIRYGLAVYDLAYAIVPWWPHDFRVEHQAAILRRWFEHLDRPEYSWEQARLDWELSVEHCLHVPIEWCRDPAGVTEMRGLWEWQLGNITGI
jgi:thiamine kinase-like enzyme